MGTVLEAVATAHPAGRGQPSSTRLAVDAAQRALGQRPQAAGDIDLLLNAGVYRDDHIMEPANATFMQRLLGMNLDVRTAAGGGTLAFDIANGACGVLSAFQVADGFIGTGSARRALVLASDVDPAPGVTEGFRYAPAGAAFLLGLGGSQAGFEAFDLRTYPRYAALHESSIDWIDGRHVLRLREDPTYRSQCLACLQDALGNFLDERDLDPVDIDLLVGWPLPPDHVGKLAAGLGVDPACVADAGDADAAHTAGVGLALEAAMATPRYARARRVLLCTVGSGITVAIASYRNDVR